MKTVIVEDAVEQADVAEENQAMGSDSDQFDFDDDYEDDILPALDGGPDCLGPQRVYSSKLFTNKSTGKPLGCVQEVCGDEEIAYERVVTYGVYFVNYYYTDGRTAADFMYRDSFCEHTDTLRHDSGERYQLGNANLLVDSMRVVTEDDGEYSYTEYVNCGETKEAPDTITRYRFDKEWAETVPSLVECDGPATTFEL